MAIEQFDTFLSIVRNGSFSKASKEMYLSQPAITNRIQRFELEIGIHLFQRTPTGVELTEEGSILLPFIEAADARFEAGLNAVREHMESGSHDVVFRYCEDETSSILPQLIAFLDNNSYGLNVKFVRGDTENNLKAIMAHEADAALLAEVDPEKRELDESLRYHFLFRDPIALLIQPDHPFVNNPPRISDLVGCRVIVYNHPSFDPLLRQIERHVVESGQTIDVKVVEHMDEAIMWLGLDKRSVVVMAGSARMVANNLGYAIVPLMGAEALKAGCVTRGDCSDGTLKFVAVAKKAYKDFGAL